MKRQTKYMVAGILGFASMYVLPLLQAPLHLVTIITTPFQRLFSNPNPHALRPTIRL